jgi:hypothetical protein
LASGSVRLSAIARASSARWRQCFGSLMWDIPARVDAGGRAFQGAQRAPWGDQGARCPLPLQQFQQSFTGELRPSTFLERLTICSLVSLTWQGHAPQPPKILPSFRSPAVPPAGLYLFGARCSRNSQLWNAFPGLREVDRVAARGLGHLFRVNMGQFCPISPCF